MIQQVQLEGFHYKVADTIAVMPDKTKMPMKILAIQDTNNTGVVFNFLFSYEMFEDFIRNISSKKIVEAKSLDNIIPFQKK